MRKYSFTDKNGKTWERITKKQARAAYNNGLTVLFCPVNMRPFTPWHLEIDVNKNFEGYNGVTFEKAVNAFEFYNCIDNETGRYTAFYIPVVTGLYGSFKDDITKTYDYRFLEV